VAARSPQRVAADRHEALADPIDTWTPLCEQERAGGHEGPPHKVFDRNRKGVV
jgi:hypothetical protein